MEDYRKNIIDIINEMRGEVKKFELEAKTNKQYTNEIDEIIDKLKNLKKAIKPTQTSLDKKIKFLRNLNIELNKIKKDVTLTEKDKMFEVIQKNLLDGMSMKEDEDNKNRKKIIFETETVGYIEILDEHEEEIKIRVTVYDNIEDFEIIDPARMYSIISFVNTKFNYK